MGRVVDIPWVGGAKIPWVGVNILCAEDRQSIGRRLDIPWILVSSAMGRGVKIP
jgi:hypothetical protein